MDNKTYERLVESLNVREFKIHMRFHCSMCDQRQECSTYLLWRYLEETFPTGYSNRQFLTVPDDLKSGLEKYKEKYSLSDWYDM